MLDQRRLVGEGRRLALSRGAVPFDGLSSVPSDLLTVRRGGDVETFDTRRNLHARNFEEKFFHDEPNLMIQPVDGMVVGGQYWLTAGVVRRLWDVRLVRVGRQLIALERMHVGFDVLGTSRDVGALGFDQSKLARVGSWIDDQVKAGFSGTSVLVCVMADCLASSCRSGPQVLHRGH